MGRRKRREKEEIAETLNSRNTGKDEGSLSANIEEEEEGEGNGKFFACYLLTSLSPRFKGHCYIGFTVNPRRRIRQHNGEITSGAWRTKRKRPWEMVLCIYGFPTNVAALQFEWAWQHPVESVAVRQAASTFKSRSGLANKIKLAYTMLNLPSWQSLNLTINYFSTKYTKHAATCPRLPDQMRVQICSIDELPCYTGSNLCVDHNYELDAGDDDHELSGGSQESIEREPADARKHNDVVMVQFDVEHGQHGSFEHGRWHTKNAVLGQLKNSQLGESSTLSGSSCNNNMTSITQDRELFHLPHELLRRSNNPGVETIADYNQLLQQNSATAAPSFFASSCKRAATTVQDKRGIFGSLNERIAEHYQREDRQTPEKVITHEEQRPRTASEVEIIDLFTPSPCCKANSGSKRRRLPEADVIDLTESPLFV